MPPAAEERQDGDGEVVEEEDGSWVNADLLQGLLEGGTLLKIDVERALGKGENYLSVIYRARLEYHPAKSQDLRVKNLIVKGTPPGEVMNVLVEEFGFFCREIAIYEDALPRFYDFADARLGHKPFSRLSASSYKTPRSDTLILDDLRPDGFVMASRRDRLDLAHSTLVMKNLARWHALSAAYSEEYPKYMEQFTDIMYCENSRNRLETFVPPQVQSIADVCSKWDGFSIISKKLAALANNCISKLIELSKPLKGGRNVLLHGDCWINNFLFKYSETNQPVDFRFVDFQLSHRGSPALDLNYFLFSSPRTDVREHYFDDLLREYCDEFERCAKELGFGGPLITFEEMYKEIDRTLYFGFVSALTTVAVVLADPEDAPDLSTVTEEQLEKGGEGVNVFGKVHRSKAFKEAFTSLLPFFDERGVLD